VILPPPEPDQPAAPALAALPGAGQHSPGMSPARQKSPRRKTPNKQTTKQKNPARTNQKTQPPSPQPATEPVKHPKPSRPTSIYLLGFLRERRRFGEKPRGRRLEDHPLSPRLRARCPAPHARARRHGPEFKPLPSATIANVRAGTGGISDGQRRAFPCRRGSEQELPGPLQRPNSQG